MTMFKYGRIETRLPPLKQESLLCLHRFMAYTPTPFPRRLPLKSQASVAIILFVGRLGDLYVLLSTRAGGMRSYASDTALPGGKYEPGDASPEDTARREAYEEIGLPIDKERVLCLTTLDLFLTGNGLLVTPVVLLVTDNTIHPILNPSEVSYLFSMPLASFLHSNPTFIPGWNYGLSSRQEPFLPSSSHGGRAAMSGQTHQGDGQKENTKRPGKEYTTRWEDEPRRKGGVLVPVPSSTEATWRIEGEAFPGGATKLKVPPPPPIVYANGAGVVGGKGVYYQYRDVPWGVGTVRFHRFLTGKEGGGVKPVYGLTAAILIHAACIGYSAQTAFAREAPNQPDMWSRIDWEARNGTSRLRTSIEEEGLSEEWGLPLEKDLPRAKL